MKALLLVAAIASLTGATASCVSQNNNIDAFQAYVQIQKLAIAVDVSIAWRRSSLTVMVMAP